jgi:hypothetical protein
MNVNATSRATMALLLTLAASMPGCIECDGLLGSGMEVLQKAGCDELDGKLAALRAEIGAIERERSRCYPPPAVEVPRRRAPRSSSELRAAVTLGTYDVPVSDVILFGGPLTLKEVILLPFVASCAHPAAIASSLYRG